MEPDPGDPNHRPLADNRRRLASVRLTGGEGLKIVEIPMPDPLMWQGRRLPASYVNFYVANGVVLVPQFGCPQDRRAREILGACFPARRVIPVDCRHIAVGLGAVHCLTQQVPMLSYTPGNADRPAAAAGMD